LLHHLLLWLLFIGIHPVFQLLAAFEKGQLLGFDLDRLACFRVSAAVSLVLLNDGLGSGHSNILKKQKKTTNNTSILVLIDQFSCKNWPIKDGGC